MELIHADENLVELKVFPYIKSFDAEISLTSSRSNSDDLRENDFELLLDKDDYLADPVYVGHFIYESGTEWGGRVEAIDSLDGVIAVRGVSWRGMLLRKCILPDLPTSAYFTITAMEANLAIRTLLGTQFGTLIVGSTENSGITVSGQFRYDLLLVGIDRMLRDSNARLKIVFDGTKATLSAIATTLLDFEFSQDYPFKLESTVDHIEAYNHIIGLGSGKLKDRDVTNFYRASDGTISSTPLPNDEDLKTYVYDYPNAESKDDLDTKSVLKLKEFVPVESVKMEIDEPLGLELGDKVSGKDQITGLSIQTQISKKIRQVNDKVDTTLYKVGE